MWSFIDFSMANLLDIHINLSTDIHMTNYLWQYIRQNIVKVYKIFIKLSNVQIKKRKPKINNLTLKQYCT